MFVMVCTVHGSTGTWRVRPGQNLQHAVDEAARHDTILLGAGRHATTQIWIRRPLVIVGEPGAIVDAGGKGEVFTVESDSVVIRDLEIRGSGISYVQENAAVKINSSRSCVVENNFFVGNFFAVYLSNASDCVIRDNRFQSALRSESASGNGIHLWYCNRIEIVGNRISGHRDGIYFEFVRNSRIERNEATGNLRYGLHFMFSDSCEYRDNVFSNNSAGVAVMYSRDLVMERNRFADNWGSASYGLLLKDISGSRISDNRIQNNSIGIYSEGCLRNVFEGNVFAQNGWALRIMANSEKNRFVSNSFVSNTFEVSTNSRNVTSNEFDRNYWSDYRGYDLNKDGTGDIPHRPVRLFSVLIDLYPGSRILLRSLLQDLLEVAERIMPALTPPYLEDRNPQMKPA